MPTLLSRAYPPPACTLHAGVVGLGRIGEAVVKRLSGFESNFVYCGPADDSVVAGLNKARSRMQDGACMHRRAG